MLNLKLGKAPKKEDHRTLKLGTYLKVAELPSLPPTYGWTDKVTDWGMLLNDILSDCVPAAMLHQRMSWLADNAIPFVATDQNAIDVYSGVAGYNPADPSTDGGTVELDALNWWRNTGILGDKITAYVELNISKIDELKYAIYLFGGAILGVQLPLAIQGAAKWGPPPAQLTPDWAVGSWGGHGIVATAFDDNLREFTVITWGQPMQMSYDFLPYLEEGYAIQANDFATAAQIAPNGFDFASLEQDLKSLSA